MVTEKRQKQESLAWGRRLHLALKAYQELLLTVHAMGKSKDTVLVNNRFVPLRERYHTSFYDHCPTFPHLLFSSAARF